MLQYINMMRFFTLFIVVLSIENKDGHCVYEKNEIFDKNNILREHCYMLFRKKMNDGRMAWIVQRK